mgnify:CR=1 FL=1
MNRRMKRARDTGNWRALGGPEVEERWRARNKRRATKRARRQA